MNNTWGVERSVWREELQQEVLSLEKDILDIEFQYEWYQCLGKDGHVSNQLQFCKKLEY